MNLTAIAEKAAAIAFDVAGDALDQATLHIGGTTTQNFHTDDVVKAGVSDVPTEGVFYHTRQQQALGVTNDGIFMIKGTAVPDGIDEADTLTFTSGQRAGQTWQIYAVESVPTAAVWLLSVRR